MLTHLLCRVSPHSQVNNAKGTMYVHVVVFFSLRMNIIAYLTDVVRQFVNHISKVPSFKW